MDFYKERLGKLFKNGELDAIMLINGKSANSNFLYMTGLTSGVFESAPLLLLKDKMILFTNVLEYEIAKRQANSRMEVVNIKSSKEFIGMLLPYTKNKTIGFDGSSLLFKSYENVKRFGKPKKLMDVGKSFAELRSIKEGSELQRIRKANVIARKAFNGIEESFRVGMTEKQVAAKLDFLMMHHGADEPSFKTIVCFGANSALPHHSPTEAKLRANNLVLIDAGAKYQNYCSDLTRTFIFKPEKHTKRHARMADMYETVKMAHDMAFRAIRPGIPGSSVHKVAQDFIDSYGGGTYKGKFIHALGHSIGIDVHDSEIIALAPKADMKLQKGMVFSDEPGIYVNGFGGVRIEDDIVVTKNGASFL